MNVTLNSDLPTPMLRPSVPPAHLVATPPLPRPCPALYSDLALALCLDAQQLARPDLRLAVMSATLGGGLAERVAELMDTDSSGSGSGSGVPVVVSQGRSYPVGECRARPREPKL